MSDLALSGAELLAWTDETATRWTKFLAENPAVFALPCDIAGVHNVAELLQHIVAVELRHAQRFTGEEPIGYADVPCNSIEELAEMHRRAHTLVEGLLKQPDFAWAEKISFVTRSAGTLTVSRRKIFFHAQMHSIRHYAQLTTIARQHGYKPEWMGDFIGTETME